MLDDPTTIQRLIETEGYQSLAPQLQVALFMGAFALLSSALVTLTAFSRIVIVLSFVRRALSTQEIPPTPVLLGLAMFLTFFIMGPTFTRIEIEAVRPYLDGDKSGPEAWSSGAQAMRTFMLSQTRTRDLELFVDLAGVEPLDSPSSTPLHVLIPAFVVSELQTAFIMGFCLYLPFVLIDLVVSVLLMSLGMMMMPPVVISTPLKILLFVLVDGWEMIARAISVSFG